MVLSSKCNMKLCIRDYSIAHLSKKNTKINASHVFANSNCTSFKSGRTVIKRKVVNISSSLLTLKLIFQLFGGWQFDLNHSNSSWPSWQAQCFVNFHLRLHFLKMKIFFFRELGDNNLYGSIPSEIFSLSYLQKL